MTETAFDRFLERSLRPLRRLWASQEPLDAFGLVHMASAAGDALVGVALADSVFFSLPTGEAKLRVALYLALTMAPLAVAAPLLVPLLDRAGPRRAIAVTSAAGRALLALYAGPRLETLVLFPVAFGLLVLSKVHAITKNGLTVAYAPSTAGLVGANARLGRMAVAGVVVAVPFGLLLLWIGDAATVLYLAASVYVVAGALVMRLAPPSLAGPSPGAAVVVGKRGKVESLALAATGTAGLRAAAGFLLFLVAFALRREGLPSYWLGAAVLGGTGGALLADLTAPRLPATVREESVVLAALVVTGVFALLSYEVFELITLLLLAAAVGAGTEFGRLAFQSLMQRTAPSGAHGRVFVRYEVVFQLAWVLGALLPALLPIGYRLGVLLLTAFYLVVAAIYVLRPRMGAATDAPAPPRPDVGPS